MVTCRFQEMENSIGHPFDSTDPLKFNNIGKQKVNIFPLIWHATTPANLSVAKKKINTKIIDNYAWRPSLTHIIKFPVFFLFSD